LVGLRHRLLGFRLAVRAGLQSIDRGSEAHPFQACARACGASGRSDGFEGHVAGELVEVDPKIVRHVDRRDALAEVFEVGKLDDLEAQAV